TVSTTGVVTAVATGQTSVTATVEGKQASASVTVGLEPVGTVTVSPPPEQLFVGSTHQLTATVRAANGSELEGRQVTWSTSDPQIATVNATGLVKAEAAGEATVTASSGGKSGTVT